MSRRGFLEVLGTAVALGAWADPRLIATAESLEPGWFDGPMRWAQLTLVENDPGRFDPAFWLDYFARIHADAATLSAGGIVAYYPTDIPLHHRSAWLGDTDPFGTLVKGCRALGMRVVARTDPHAVRDDVQAAHPDWIAVNADGSPRRHWANTDLWVACTLGPYTFDFMDRVHREIVGRYRVDGIFANRWEPQGGDCFCVHCQEGFRTASGHEIPRSNDPQDPARRAYIDWRIARMVDLWRHWDATIRAAHAEARFIPNYPPSMKTVGELAAIQFADHQGRSGYAAPWAFGKRAKEYRSVMGRRPIGGIFSVGVEERYRWKDSVQSGPEVRTWVAEGTAHGMRPWVTKFGGVLHDRRWLPVVERLYDWHWKHERYLRNERPLARVAMLFSEQTQTYHAGVHPRDRAGDHVLGMYHALVEARVPFEMVHEASLTPERLDSFRMIVLADTAALSDEQCEAIRAYVRRGGSVLATFATSLFDEIGRPRKEFGLSDVFGVSFTGTIDGPMQNSYLTLEGAPSGERHPIVDGFGDTTRIVNGAFRLNVRPTQEFASPLTLVPTYPDLPMEDVYPRVPHTDTRELYVREPGRSRVTYFPWDVSRIFWEVLSVDHGRLLANAVRWTVDEPSPVEVTGPGVIDVSIWQQRQSVTVHLVNLTNPMLMKGPIREVIPVGAQRVTIRLPDGLRARGVRLLTAGTEPDVDARGGVLSLTVPSIDVHEVVAVDV